MYIKFKTITTQNFMSIGKPMTFHFQEGIDLIVGENGCGKSILSSDSLFYALYGKAYRKVKNGSLQNKINKKNLLVTLDFQIEKEPYRIIRGMHPNIFKIYKGGYEEEFLIPQNATIKEYQTYLEDYIIKSNETITRQLMILGTNSNSSKPFLELNSIEKEEMFSTITDTQIFSYIKDIIKKKVQEQKTQVSDLTYKVNLLTSTISSEKMTIEQMRKQNEDFNKNHKLRIQQMTEEISVLRTTSEKYTDGLRKLKEVKNKYDANMLELKRLEADRNIIVDTISTLNHQLKYIETAEHNAVECEKCKHINYLVEVDVNSKNNIQEQIVSETNAMAVLNDEIQSIKTITDKQKEGLLNGKRLKDNLADFARQIQSKEQQIEKLNEYTPVEITYDEIERKEQELVDAKEKLHKHTLSIQDYGYIGNLVNSDNLKGLIISKQLPILNKFINMYLEKFSLLGYNFVVDKDFKEHIISRGEDSEFNQLSNGQKARISFAIMFAFLRLIEERNGSKLNILTLDEALDSSLDATGREELLDILKDEFSKDKNILIVSHNADIKEKLEVFDRIITVTRDTFTNIQVEDI